MTPALIEPLASIEARLPWLSKVIATQRFTHGEVRDLELAPKESILNKNPREHHERIYYVDAFGNRIGAMALYSEFGSEAVWLHDLPFWRKKKVAFLIVIGSNPIRIYKIHRSG